MIKIAYRKIYLSITISNKSQQLHKAKWLALVKSSIIQTKILIISSNNIKKYVGNVHLKW